MEIICLYSERLEYRMNILSVIEYVFRLTTLGRGWACVKEALEFPTSTTFSKVTGLTNRPLSIEDSKLPKDSRLQLVSGIDLTGSADDVLSAMKQKIQGIDTVTHVIFTAYIEKPDFESLRTVNTDILKTGITAVDQLAPHLESVVLQTGGKAYGVEFSDKLEIKPPLKESQPRIPKPCAYHFSSPNRSVIDADCSWQRLRQHLLLYTA